MSIDHQVKAFILGALLRKGSPFPVDTLKGCIRAGFPGVSFTDGDLNQWIRELENAGMIAGTDDPISGTVWDLTTKGKIKAQSIL